MDNIIKYNPRQQKLAQLFNISLLHWNNVIEIGDQLVYQLVLEACDDTIFQQKVLDKLTYYTSFTKEYLSGIHLKPKKFHIILQNIKKYILERIAEPMRYPEDDFETGETCDDGFLINFEFDNGIDSYKPSSMLTNGIKFNDNNMADLTRTGYSFDYEDLFLYSVIGAKTIKKHGYDGFLALLLIYLPEKNFIKEKEVESLAVKCSKNIAEKFNNLLAFETKISRLEPRPSIKPRLRLWLELFEYLKNVPDEQIEICAKYMNGDIQRVFFKRVDFDNENIFHNLYTYHTNYDNIIDDIVELCHVEELVSYIKDIHSATTLAMWRELLTNLLKLSNKKILRILGLIDHYFSEVLLNLEKIKDFRVDIFNLQLSSKTSFEIIDGTRYAETRVFFALDTKQIRQFHCIYRDNNVKETHTWIYDENLEVVDIKKE